MRYLFTTLTLLFILSTQALADFVVLDKLRYLDSVFEYLVDKNSFTLEKKRYVTFRSVENIIYDSGSLLPDKSFERLNRIDCKKKRIQFITLTSYFKLFAKGRVLSVEEKDREWRYYKKLKKKNNPWHKHILYVCSQVMLWD